MLLSLTSTILANGKKISKHGCNKGEKQLVHDDNYESFTYCQHTATSIRNDLKEVNNNNSSNTALFRGRTAKLSKNEPLPNGAPHKDRGPSTRPEKSPIFPDFVVARQETIATRSPAWPLTRANSDGQLLRGSGQGDTCSSEDKTEAGNRPQRQKVREFHRRMNRFAGSSSRSLDCANSEPEAPLQDDHWRQGQSPGGNDKKEGLQNLSDHGSTSRIHRPRGALRAELSRAGRSQSLRCLSTNASKLDKEKMRDELGLSGPALIKQSRTSCSPRCPRLGPRLSRNKSFTSQKRSVPNHLLKRLYSESNLLERSEARKVLVQDCDDQSIGHEQRAVLHSNSALPAPDGSSAKSPMYWSKPRNAERFSESSGTTKIQSDHETLMPVRSETGSNHSSNGDRSELRRSRTRSLKSLRLSVEDSLPLESKVGSTETQLDESSPASVSSNELNIRRLCSISALRSKFSKTKSRSAQQLGSNSGLELEHISNTDYSTAGGKLSRPGSLPTQLNASSLLSESSVGSKNRKLRSTKIRSEFSKTKSSSVRHLESDLDLRSEFSKQQSTSADNLVATKCGRPPRKGSSRIQLDASLCSEQSYENRQVGTSSKLRSESTKTRNNGVQQVRRSSDLRSKFSNMRSRSAGNLVGPTCGNPSRLQSPRTQLSLSSKRSFPNSQLRSSSNSRSNFSTTKSSSFRDLRTGLDLRSESSKKKSSSADNLVGTRCTPESWRTQLDASLLASGSSCGLQTNQSHCSSTSMRSQFPRTKCSSARQLRSNSDLRSEFAKQKSNSAADIDKIRRGKQSSAHSGCVDDKVYRRDVAGPNSPTKRSSNTRSTQADTGIGNMNRELMAGHRDQSWVDSYVETASTKRNPGSSVVSYSRGLLSSNEPTINNLATQVYNISDRNKRKSDQDNKKACAGTLSDCSQKKNQSKGGSVLRPLVIKLAAQLKETQAHIDELHEKAGVSAGKMNPPPHNNGSKPSTCSGRSTNEQLLEKELAATCQRFAQLQKRHDATSKDLTAVQHSRKELLRYSEVIALELVESEETIEMLHNKLESTQTKLADARKEFESLHRHCESLTLTVHGYEETYQLQERHHEELKSEVEEYKKELARTKQKCQELQEKAHKGDDGLQEKCAGKVVESSSAILADEVLT